MSATPSHHHRTTLFCLLLAVATLLATPNSRAAARKPAPESLSASAVAEFANEMASMHGFDAAELRARFAQLHINPAVLKAIQPPSSPKQRSWLRYRSNFLTESRIASGLDFWRQHAATLARARMEYGVPEEIIVAIIGVETFYGRITGRFNTLEALATLAFHYPPRRDFFRSELEQFLLLARENGLDPLNVQGSFAGALGIPQFMPGSQRRYAVDFDRDGRIDLIGSVEDAIGSVARFLERHGWQAGQAVARPIALEPAASIEPLLEAGIRPTLTATQLNAAGIRLDSPLPENAALIDLLTPETGTEYWLGFGNFYAITRYNRSSFYAMAVYQLAEALRTGKDF